MDHCGLNTHCILKSYHQSNLSEGEQSSVCVCVWGRAFVLNGFFSFFTGAARFQPPAGAGRPRIRSVSATDAASCGSAALGVISGVGT